MSSRPRALGPLAAFWLGGVTISATLAGGVLFGLRDRTVAMVHRVQLATATPTAGYVQLAMGALALLIAAVAVGLPTRQRMGAVAQPTTFSSLSARAHYAVQSRPLTVAFTLGVGMLIDFRFLAALTAIVASGAATGTQIGAAALYTLVALAFVELPLVGRLAAPARTDYVMSAVNRWAAVRRQQIFGIVIALLGAFLLSRGLGHR